MDIVTWAFLKLAAKLRGIFFLGLLCFWFEKVNDLIYTQRSQSIDGAKKKTSSRYQKMYQCTRWLLLVINGVLTPINGHVNG